MSAIQISRKISGYQPMSRLFLAGHELTDCQRDVLNYMREFLSDNDCLPSTSQVAAHFGWKSATSAQHHIEQLVRLRRLEENSVGKLRFVRVV